MKIKLKNSFGSKVNAIFLNVVTVTFPVNDIDPANDPSIEKTTVSVCGVTQHRFM